MSEVTRLLEAAQTGDRAAAAKLFPLVYDELRKLAAAKMVGEPAGHTLDGTALVHEAFLRLGADQSFSSKSAFLRAAAESMRRILIDHARTRRADKRGGGRVRVELPDQPDSWPDDDLLALDQALSELELHDAASAELIKLRFFAGYSHSDAAAALGLTRRQADGMWAAARAWLFRRLRSG
jgi:RNA polymerase sigma factor (TIGR02999 family)